MLDVRHDRCQDMAVIRVSGQSLGGEHELPTFRALQAVDRLSPLVQPLLKHRACELEGLAEYGLVMLASAIITGVFM